MKNKGNIQRISTLNCQRLIVLSEQWALGDDFMRYNIPHGNCEAIRFLYKNCTRGTKLM